MTAPGDLQELVAAWLPTQRWFGGKGRLSTITIELLTALSTDVDIWLATVAYADGEAELYQLPLTSRSEPEEFLEHVLLGTIERDGALSWIYDALHDKNLTDVWLESIRDDVVTDVLRFERSADPDSIPVGKPSLVLTGEQSNTSLMYGDSAILKVFRRLQPGINPDVEIGQALAVQGAQHVPLLMGSVTGAYAGADYALAMLQEYMTTATDGWELAKASVRDLMAEADLHAEEAGGDFAGEAHRLGAAVAQVHADLATAFGSAPLDDLAARAGAMHERLDHALTVVAELAPLEAGLRALYVALANAAGDLTSQRIHGDLHLGQVLRTANRWVLIDFEGEPMASLDERRLPDSPLRDIAGMLRSFEYAGYHRILETGYQPQLAYRAAEWAQRNRDAFCDGYAEEAGYDPREHPVALHAYEADKAVYEALYEARNRPAWLALPLASLARLAPTTEAQEGSA
ncbi:aminoglycoside phosphotransferase [Jatrophihabitans sp.]|uniref:maltokinase N-terminal cap-like domain-containing protein n=1 Tax=Jatrophihabitans sp. TaxID=1932789 RepID=UPI0030C6CF81|nr:aminoglycoside phosphotransferase [Jatrophihabitans sp.]